MENGQLGDINWKARHGQHVALEFSRSGSDNKSQYSSISTFLWVRFACAPEAATALTKALSIPQRKKQHDKAKAEVHRRTRMMRRKNAYDHEDNATFSNRGGAHFADSGVDEDDLFFDDDDDDANGKFRGHIL